MSEQTQKKLNELSKKIMQEIDETVLIAASNLSQEMTRVKKLVADQYSHLMLDRIGLKREYGDYKVSEDSVLQKKLEAMVDRAEVNIFDQEFIDSLTLTESEVDKLKASAKKKFNEVLICRVHELVKAMALDSAESIAKSYFSGLRKELAKTPGSGE